MSYSANRPELQGPINPPQWFTIEQKIQYVRNVLMWMNAK